MVGKGTGGGRCTSNYILLTPLSECHEFENTVSSIGEAMELMKMSFCMSFEIDGICKFLASYFKEDYQNGYQTEDNLVGNSEERDLC